MSASSVAVKRIREQPELFSYGVSRVWHPRGLIYSVLLHATALLALCFGPLEYPDLYWHTQRPMQLTMMDTSDDSVLLLPNLGGGSPGEAGGGAPAGGSPRAGEAGPVGKRGTGAIYKGPQPIVSNPPNPDNNLQTIRQPELVNPPKLKFPIQAPDMVMLARSSAPAPVLATPPRPPEPPPPPQVVRHNLGTANIPVPLTAAPPPPSPDLAELVKLPLPTPAAPHGKLEGLNASPTPPAPPSAAPPREATPSGSGGADEHDLVVLNAVKSSVRAGMKLPAMEEYGAFVVSPKGGTSTGQTGTGLEKTGSPGTGGTGTVAGAGTGAGSGTGKNGGTGSGAGAGTGTGTGTGSGPGSGLGKGNGTGSGVGPGNGTGKGGPGAGGTGTGSGSGHGPGSGPGGGPFAGISIQGGGNGGGSRGGGGSHRGSGGSYSYGMTIIASAGSGGGLKDFGIFRNEVSYTVYINTSDPGQPRGDWTLQYAVIHNPTPSSPAADPPGNPAPPARAMVSPPFPLTKEMPQYPAQVAAENLGRLIVVSAVISAEGKVQAMRVLQSPNGLLSTAAVEALGKWQFRPAEVNGAPVAVKALLGIPVAAR